MTVLLVFLPYENRGGKKPKKDSNHHNPGYKASTELKNGHIQEFF
jgi:hypothetical protein